MEELAGELSICNLNKNFELFLLIKILNVKFSFINLILARGLLLSGLYVVVGLVTTEHRD